MAKAVSANEQVTDAPVTDASESASAEIALTLTEFCTRLSVTVKRPELIGAFEFDELRNKRKKDTESAFRARFDEFIKTPV